MSEPKKGLASLGLGDAIRLRCAQRDIEKKRLKLTPVDPNDMRTLIDMGCVEMITTSPSLSPWVRNRLRSATDGNGPGSETRSPITNIT
jgi:hypothetical protein